MTTTLPVRLALADKGSADFLKSGIEHHGFSFATQSS